MNWVVTYVATAHRLGEAIRLPPFPPEARGSGGDPPDPSWIQQVDMVWDEARARVIILWRMSYWRQE